ncbi:cysteine desulfurase, partial [Candidatus Uhrbacteria bacterium]|nr:cysteine desulfurase [Candidatus Uhrbacteria bacterium]
EKLVGNPGAIHREAVEAKKSLEDSRARIAVLLGCKAREIIFTSGLTEANNLAIVGYAKWLERTRRSLKGTHWIVSSIEHDSVLESFAEVERMGGIVTHIRPDGRGLILPEVLEKTLRPETVFVSIGWANNEIGTIQPLAKIARVIREHENNTSLTCVHKSDLCGCAERVVFHSDAGQAPLYLATVVSSLGIDLLALGANKLHGPHGIGALYISKRTSLVRMMAGGAQERGLRAGTESVALAAGFAAAYERVAHERERESKRIRILRDDLAQRLMRIPGVEINGDQKETLPYMLNVSIPPKPELSERTSEYLALALDARGIAVSTKSACREGEESRSHVVDALGGGEWRAQNTLRFSLGRDTTASDIVRCAKVLTNVLSQKDSKVRP